MPLNVLNLRKERESFSKDGEERGFAVVTKRKKRDWRTAESEIALFALGHTVLRRERTHSGRREEGSGGSIERKTKGAVCMCLRTSSYLAGLDKGGKKAGDTVNGWGGEKKKEYENRGGDKGIAICMQE